MGKGKQKIEIKKITNPQSRLVTFSKRRKGLFKKAQDLCDLFPGIRVAAIVFSPAGNPYVFGDPLSIITQEIAPNASVLGASSDIAPNASVLEASSSSNPSSSKISEIKEALRVDVPSLGLDELCNYSDRLKGLRAQLGLATEQMKSEENQETIEKKIENETLIMGEDRLELDAMLQGFLCDFDDQQFGIPGCW